ncbi:hypothetical protein ULMS_20560 [Patiriisocius marinistellae]|uniref:Outer membrane protein beta-barrel domain-containing protein n=1 Tax=Patiriisocius marinistellae TaxID=2494560 RepID=A0A5J4FYS8_9FLAO|nr:porin family protein [Patiriisocius marinistellae]GEQ86548.1 hypothetical protein ULMS_20560 [Patiriisocius marinistellae]
MKNIILISISFLLGLSTMAQDLNFGLSAGYISGDGKISGGDTINFDQDAETGFYAGVLVEFELTKRFRVQPEVLYVNIDDSNFLQIPLMVKLYPIPKLYIQAGPQFTYTLEEIFDDFTKLNLGIGAGAGFDIAFGFYVNARYTFQVNNYYTGPADIKSQINFLNAGIGFKF